MDLRAYGYLVIIFLRLCKVLGILRGLCFMTDAKRCCPSRQLAVIAPMTTVAMDVVRVPILVMSCLVPFPLNVQMPVFWLKLFSWHKAVKMAGSDGALRFWAGLLSWGCVPSPAARVPRSRMGVRGQGRGREGPTTGWFPSPLRAQLSFFFFLLVSYLFLRLESVPCAPEAFKSPCVFCPEGNSLVLYLVICWLCSFLALLYNFLLCANSATPLNNNGAAAAFPLQRVKLASLWGASCLPKQATKAGYQSSTAFPV